MRRYSIHLSTESGTYSGKLDAFVIASPLPLLLPVTLLAALSTTLSFTRSGAATMTIRTTGTTAPTQAKGLIQGETNHLWLDCSGGVDTASAALASHSGARPGIQCPRTDHPASPGPARLPHPGSRPDHLACPGPALESHPGPAHHPGPVLHPCPGN